jgi:hypothetical protein
MISLLAGVIGGVSFGTILWRSILGAAGFGALGFGTLYLIEKYLPELTGAEGASEPGSEGVDIVIEDEAMPPRESGAEQEFQGPDLGEIDEESEEGADFVEEVEETVGETENSEEGRENEDYGTSEESTDETTEFIPTDITSDIDTLPDIGELSGSFEGGEGSDMQDYDGGSTGGSGGGRSGRSSTVDVLGEEKDPQEIAKAVQTILKKE